MEKSTARRRLYYFTDSPRLLSKNVLVLECDDLGFLTSTKRSRGIARLSVQWVDTATADERTAGVDELRGVL